MSQNEERFCKPRGSGSCGISSTRFLYVAGIGAEMGSNADQLRAFFSQFGELDYSCGDPIDMVPNRRYCYVCYCTVEGAENAASFVNDKDKCDGAMLTEAIGASKIVARYAIEKHTLPAPNEMECTSSERNQSVSVPGCLIIPDYISEHEESALLDELAGSDVTWKETLSRRVQHFGFPFNYRTLMLDYNKPTPPLPASCIALTERFASTFNEYTTSTDTTLETAVLSEELADCNITPPTSQHVPSDNITENASSVVRVEAGSFNQLTINEYLPGQGIAPHTDTETCLGPVIFILNLGSAIVMALTKPPQQDSTEDVNQTKKLLHLPARSLLVLSGEARYLWQHGIAQRRSDRIDGELVPRGRRISLTFRQALKPGKVLASQLKPGELELDHVVRVYDNIAVHWNHTRGKRKVYWHRVKDFLDALPVGTLMADVGCGDGKYFGVNPGVVTIGCDRSIKLLEVCRDESSSSSNNNETTASTAGAGGTGGREQLHETFCCDAVSLPLTTDTFDATLCIAVLHHLSTVDRRYAVISELLRITKPGGVVMIQAWALEQGSDSKRTFDSQDTMVPWRLSKRFLSDAQQQTLLQKSVNSGKDQIEDEAESVSEESAPLERVAESPATTESGPCRHVTEESGELVFQRYCHVYKEGELEALCSSIPGCMVIESGWDKGNWFVQLQKVREDRLEALPLGPESKIPVLASRTNH